MTEADAVASDRLDVLVGFAEAYNHHDVESIMGYMSDDVSFVSFFGPDACGERFEGREAVRQRVEAGLEAIPDGKWLDARHFVAGERGVSEWTFRATGPDGGTIERNGVDLFTFIGNRIRVKDTYQKLVQPQPQSERS